MLSKIKQRFAHWQQNKKFSRFVEFIKAIVEHLLEKLPFFSLIKIIYTYLWESHRKMFIFLCVSSLVLGGGLFTLIVAEIVYINFDSAPSRGAHRETIYLDQGWEAKDSLYFYNTSIGSNLLPYDFFVSLKSPNADTLINDPSVYDRFRFLPQQATFSNPDSLAVGFVKDRYKGREYVGLTCAACHTSQIVFSGKAVRIDGGPAQSDLQGYLRNLNAAIISTLNDQRKLDEFISSVLDLNGDYSTRAEVISSLKMWNQKFYNRSLLNGAPVDHGFSRTDFFGHIFNEIKINTINKAQFYNILSGATQLGKKLLTPAQVSLVLVGLNETSIGIDGLAIAFERLASSDDGYPGLNLSELAVIRNEITNPNDAPVSYPHLWGALKQDYTHWVGAFGSTEKELQVRNMHSFIGAFGSLDWRVEDAGYSLATRLSGQSSKSSILNLKSSANKVNIQRLEAHLANLGSPEWPDSILGGLDHQKAQRGQAIYRERCQSCHESNNGNGDRENTYIMGLDSIGTDPFAAMNFVMNNANSGNFEDTLQQTSIGTMFVGEQIYGFTLSKAVSQMLFANPDPDRNWWQREVDKIRSWLIWTSTSSTNTLKNGQYRPDTPDFPIRSLLSYKARPLNGVWATAPYLHNGSIPTLYDLLLPIKKAGDPESGIYRPNRFIVGSREFDPVKVGFKSSGYDGFVFDTSKPGNLNTGHEFSNGFGVPLPNLTEEQRWDLIEYLKTL